MLSTLHFVGTSALDLVHQFPRLIRRAALALQLIAYAVIVLGTLAVSVWIEFHFGSSLL